MEPDHPPGSAPPDRQLEVNVLQRPGVAPLDSDDIAGFVRRAARAAGTCADEITVVLAADAEVRRLNRDYRGTDKVTDILSFPGENVGDGVHLLGDLVIAVGRACSQAAQRHHSLETELRYLLIHGLLHLIGFDHETDGGEMEREERRLRELLRPDEVTVVEGTNR